MRPAYTNPEYFAKAEPPQRRRRLAAFASPRSQPLKERKKLLARKLADKR